MGNFTNWMANRQKLPPQLQAVADEVRANPQLQSQYQDLIASGMTPEQALSDIAQITQMKSYQAMKNPRTAPPEQQQYRGQLGRGMRGGSDMTGDVTQR